VSDIKTAFWNLQNLFDTTVSEIAADPSIFLCSD